jgi:uncharacterized protein YjlB
MIRNINNIIVQSFHLAETPEFPNNFLPLLYYRSTWNLPEKGAADEIEDHLKFNYWGNCWRDGVYDYHHYHSTAHELLAVYEGSALLLFGGDDGVKITASVGDVILIPAGVAHKCLEDHSFRCVGAYPEGQNFDMNYGKPSERPRADENIRKVKVPQADPVYGTRWPLLHYW